MNKVNGEAGGLNDEQNQLDVLDYFLHHPRPWWVGIMIGVLAVYGAGTYWWMGKLEGGKFSWESVVEIMFCISYIYFYFFWIVGEKVAYPLSEHLLLWGCPMIFPVVSGLACSIGSTGAVITLHLFGLLGQGLSMQELLNAAAMPSDWILAAMVIGFYAALGIVLEVAARLYSWIKRAIKNGS